jgi:hypothetical protein
MFTFPIVAVRKVIASGIEDAAANGGFRNPYYGTRPGEGEKPGLWLVGDEGVYLLSNGKLAEGARPLVLYSEECHPKGDIDWWDYKRRWFGGDDGIEYFAADQLIPLFDRSMGATHLQMQLTDDSILLKLIHR